MCGILGAINTNHKSGGKEIKAKPVNEWILSQYEDQHKRGTEGFGIITINEKDEIKIMRATEPIKFIIDLNLNESNKIIAHHRNPTSTENKMAQTHPIIVSNGSLKYDYAVVHNGVISNDKELQKLHESLGFVYTTKEIKSYSTTYTCENFNDTESIAIETARFIEKQTPTIGAKGSMAIIALQINKKTQKAENIFFFRNGSPLNMSKTRGKLRLSSEGEGNAIEEDVMYNCEIKGDMKLLKRSITYKVIEKEEKPIISTYLPNAGYNFNKNTKEIEKPKNRQEDIEEKLDNQETVIDVSIENLPEKFDEYFNQEKDNIDAIIDNFGLELDTNPEKINVDNTLVLIEEILLRMADTVKKTNELFESVGGQVTEYIGDPTDYINKKEMSTPEEDYEGRHIPSY
ncbi:MAG: hypothetical protein WCX46_02385 [Candidatus Paceibacterota bacterium]